MALMHKLDGLVAEHLERRRHAYGAVRHRVADIQGIGAEGDIHQVFDMADLFQVDVGKDRLAHLHALVVATGLEIKEIGPRPDQRHQRHHRFLAD